MSAWTINFTVAAFPIGWTGNYNQFAQELVSLLTATIQGNAMPGLYSQSAITLPTSDQGPIFMAGQWYYWSTVSSAYVLYNSQSVGYARSDNVLDNGDFQINQRQPALSVAQNLVALSGSITPNSWGSYLADRWIAIQDGTLTSTPTQQVLGNSGILGATDRPNTTNYLRITAGSPAIASLSAAQFCVAMQRVPLQRARILFDVQPSFSIWLRSSVVGTYCVFIQNSTAANSVVVPCAIKVVNTWTKFTFNAMNVIPYGSGGFGTNPTDWSMTIGVCAGAGGNFQQSPSSDGIWQSATRYCDSNQNNLLATANATLDMTLVQYEPASTVTAFQFKSFADSLFACQYMFCKSMPYGNAPGTGAGSPVQPNAFMPFSSSIAYGVARFPRNMRIAPLSANGGGLSNTNITLYNPNTGGTATQGSWTGGAGVALIFSATGKTNIYEFGFTEIDSSAAFTGPVSGAFLNIYSTDFTASADL